MKLIGKIKFIIERQRGYSGWINSVILFYLLINKTGLQWWYFLIIPFWLFWAWVDDRYIYPAERTYSDTKSKVLKDIKNKIK